MKKCGCTCSTKEVINSKEILLALIYIYDLEFNGKIGIQSSLYASDNADVQMKFCMGRLRSIQTSQIFSAIIPDQLAQGSFGKTFER